MKVRATQLLLDYSGIGRQRLHLGWVSSAEGQRFAEMVTELTEVARNLGPFEPGRHKSQLEALVHTLENEKVRWLLGIQRQLTEEGNVYGEKLSPETYQSLLEETLVREYQKTLIQLNLRARPLSVRELHASTRLGIQNIASLLIEMQNQGQVELHSRDEKVKEAFLLT